MRAHSKIVPVIERTIRLAPTETSGYWRSACLPTVNSARTQRIAGAARIGVISGCRVNEPLATNFHRVINTSNVLEFHHQIATEGGHCAWRVWVKMACKVCKSENTQRFEGEFTASLPDLKALKVPPIYVCQSVLVCLDCGFAELVIPTSELQAIRKAKAAAGS